MDEPFLLADCSNSASIVAVSRAAKSDLLLIQTDEGLTLVNFKTRKTEMVLSSRSWSKKLPVFYSNYLDALVAIANDSSSILLYKRSKTQKPSKNTPSQPGSKVPFKEKPKKYTLDEKILSVDPITEFLQLEDTTNGEKSYRIDLLISGEVMEDGDSKREKSAKSESEEISEVIEHVGIDCGVHGNELVSDRFLIYTEQGSKSLIKMMDVDFQKIVFEVDETSDIGGILCFGLWCIYYTSQKKVFLRHIKSPKKATLAETIKDQTKHVQVDQTKLAYSRYNDAAQSLDSFKNFCLNDPRQVDRAKLLAYLKQNCTVGDAFTQLDTLFRYLSEVNPLSDGYFFEEIIYWISLIFDSKLGELLLEDEATVKSQMYKLQAALHSQQKFFDALDETADLILPHLIESRNQPKKKDHPEPWDNYSIDVIEF